MERVACPLCGGQQHRRLFGRPDHIHQVSAEVFDVVRCEECSFVFVNPRPGVGEIGRYYPEEFYDVAATPASLLDAKRETLAARLAVMGSLQPGRLLDVGCQKGEFMWLMKERGWDVQGVEFSKLPPNVFDLPIFHGSLDDAPLSPESFDLITLWAVLEHVHDPVKVLRQVRSLLKRSGRAFVLVPNFNSIPGRWLRHDDVPRHLVMFTPRTMKQAAAKAGLRATRFVFSDDIFSGSTRGVLNTVWKRLHGETMEDIVAQSRVAGRWAEFSSQLHGRPNAFMERIDAIDDALTPYLNRVMNACHLGFIMTVELVPAHP